MGENQKLEPLMTISEACEILKVHPNTMRNWDRDGLIKSVRIGKSNMRRFKKSDIEKILKGKA